MRGEFCIPWIKQNVEVTFYLKDVFQLGVGMGLTIAFLNRENIWGAVAGVALVRELVAHCVSYPNAVVDVRPVVPEITTTSTNSTQSGEERTSVIYEPVIVGPPEDPTPLDTRDVTIVCRGEPEEVFLSRYWQTVHWHAQETHGIRVHVRRVTYYQNWQQEHQTLVKVVKRNFISHEELWEALICVRSTIDPAKIVLEEFWEHEGPETEIIPPPEYLNSAEHALADRAYEEYFQDLNIN